MKLRTFYHGGRLDIDFFFRTITINIMGSINPLHSIGLEFGTRLEFGKFYPGFYFSTTFLILSLGLDIYSNKGDEEDE